jgi:actin-related protein
MGGESFEIVAQKSWSVLVLKRQIVERKNYSEGAEDLTERHLALFIPGDEDALLDGDNMGEVLQSHDNTSQLMLLPKLVTDAVVVDFSRDTLRIGGTADTAPTAIRNFHSDVHFHGVCHFPGKWHQPEGFGELVKGFHRVSFPVSTHDGLIADWDTQEKLINFVLSKQWRDKNGEGAGEQPFEIGSLSGDLVMAPMVVIEPIFQTKDHRERTTMIMMETFNVPSVLLVSRAEAAVLAAGKRTGLVLSSGSSQTTCAAVVGGELLPETATDGGAALLGGECVEEELCRLLKAGGLVNSASELSALYEHARGGNDASGSGGDNSSSASAAAGLSSVKVTAADEAGVAKARSSRKRDFVRKVKETFCYVALDVGAETKLADEAPERVAKSAAVETSFLHRRLSPAFESIHSSGHTVRSWETLALGRERFLAPEQLFSTAAGGRGGVQGGGVQGVVMAAVEKAPPELRGALLASIVLEGGNTLLPGFAARLQREVSKCVEERQGQEGGAFLPEEARQGQGQGGGAHTRGGGSPDMRARVRVIAAAGPESAWAGGAVAASAGELSARWLTLAEYDEHGPSLSKRFGPLRQAERKKATAYSPAEEE